MTVKCDCIQVGILSDQESAIKGFDECIVNSNYMSINIRSSKYCLIMKRS